MTGIHTRTRGAELRALFAVLVGLGCGGSGASTTAAEHEREEHEETTGAELEPPGPVADLEGAAPAPAEPVIPADTTPLASRMVPRALAIPSTNRGATTRFTFDGFHRGWFARTPSGRQRLLTPVYGSGKVFVGGGFSSHQMFAYDARTGAREWAASAPDGGPSAAIAVDDKVLFNTESCTLFAVDASSGRRLWSRWLGDPLMSQPTAGDGLVFSAHIIDGESPGGLTPGTTGFGTGGGRRYAMTAMRLDNGRPRWTRAIRGDVLNAAVLAGGDLYFTTMDGTVYRMDQASGRVRWRRQLGATSAPWLEGEGVHVSARTRGGEVRGERSLVLAKTDGATLHEHDPVEAPFARARPDTEVQRGWAYEGSRSTVAGGREYLTIGNEVHCRDADTHELLWRRRYSSETRARPASTPAIAGSQLVFGTRDGHLFGLDIDTGMTAWAYDVGEPIAAQPTVAHGWVYAATTRGGVVALEVSDTSFDGWHMWGGNAAHNGRVAASEAPPEDETRPSEGTLSLEGAEASEAAGFPLTETTVHAEVSGFVARVAVEQTFDNPYERPVEATYLFPLPDDAAVDAMELHAGGRVVRANIRRREQAREEYRSARARGVLASLLEQERPNLFRQSVANIRPGDSIRVVLHYTQALPYEAGAYRFVYPMVAGPRYEAAGEGGDSEGGVRQVVLAPGGERPDRVEVTIDGDFGMALRSIESPTHELSIRREGEARVHVALSEAARPDRDLDVRFEVAGSAPTVGVLASPPAQSEDGEEEEDARGTFSLALHPSLVVPDEQIMARELVFLVDTSSSMHGRPMEMAKAAMRAALEGLQPNDSFRVLAFSDTTSALSEEALPATEANVARGRRFVDEMQALGATEMLRGVRAALEPDAEDDRMRVVLLMTDGFIGNETEVFREVHEHLGHARLFPFGVGSAVNRYLLSRLAEVGRGDAQVVTLDESPEEAAIAFHQRIARPFLTDIAIDWGELEVADAYPRRVPDLYADRPLVVHARYDVGGSSEVTIRGRVAGRPFEQTVSVQLPERGDARPELTSVWARTRIRDLMLAMALQPDSELQEEVTSLGLRHHLLTQWTSFVAVDEGYRAAGEAVRVAVPSETPAGITAPPPAAPRGGRRARSPSLEARAYGGGGAALGELGGFGAQSQGALRSAPSTSSSSTASPSRRVSRGSDTLDEFSGEENARGDRASTSAARRRCRESSRRPDGSIDPEALRRCLAALGARPKIGTLIKRLAR